MVYLVYFVKRIIFSYCLASLTGAGPVVSSRDAEMAQFIIIYLVESRRHAIVVATDTQKTQG